MPHAVALLACLAVAAVTPKSVDDIPALDRPREHFYGAIADKKRVEVRWVVSPAAAPLGEPLTLTLVVSNAVNPHELTRPPLLDFPSFRDLFSGIQDVDADPGASADATFVYRVTPRNEGAWQVPELVYNVYQPNAPPPHTTLTTHAKKVPFTVTKSPAARAAAVVAPAEFFVTRTEGAFTRGGSPRVWAWSLLFAGGAAAGLAWVVVWRRAYPTAARLAAIRRNRAVRTALDRLRRPHLSAEQVAITLRNYLIARYGLPYTAQTPAEVAIGLAAVGVPTERAAEAEGVLRACDEARFAPATGNPVTVAEVAALITRWEGVSPA